ncbi:MAG: 4-diphosphocytidyl-2C-methyl-D-erythritol kinase [Nisaea sp.]|jgi:molybdenum cofactor cytidylyltransferase|nr:4-diphosphocytidyl-2C-methyl-D-erythritol kinase [Nisaea sp.]OUX99292.1 MAG: 4-diphosphocytidyl-2C-methyl-D-erythritol kinase [Candidatus Endolissoclinum sp. TMED26]
MFFGSLPVAETEGAMLAHGMRFPDKAFKKGHVLTLADIGVLTANGINQVTVARLDSSDVAEDAAADNLAAEITGDLIDVSRSFTGRVNFFAKANGLLTYPVAHLQAFNRVDESITLAALPPNTPVSAGQMIATLKIIPFAIPRSALEIARSVAKHGRDRLFSVVAFQTLNVGLIQTRLPGTKPTVLEKTTDVTRARLAALDCSLVSDQVVDHSVQQLSRAIKAMLRDGVEMVLISGASAVVDRRDIVPAAIEHAGGQVEHFGMPVDPGNLMLFGRIGKIPAIGLPGCARSPKLNGFDWVLQRVVAGVPLGSKEIMSMGLGGFLKEIPIRPLPRADAADRPQARAPRIAIIVLAAGQSRRMGKDNKLVADVNGTAMVRHTLENIAGVVPDEPIVVTGHEADMVTAALVGLDLKIVHNPKFAAGLSTSLVTGLGALDDEVDGALVCLADMPRVSREDIKKLIAAFDPIENRAICVPTFRGKRGNPVLWGREFFDPMSRVSGDVGARHLIGAHDDKVVEVEVDSDGVILDVDTPEMLKAINNPAASAD